MPNLYQKLVALNAVSTRIVQNIIERAFQLAAESGSVDEVHRKLVREGYFQVHSHLAGRQMRGEILRRLNPELAAYRKH